MKHSIALLIRKLGLIKFADTLRFYIMYIKTRKSRKEFKDANPNLILPPPFYIYETFGLNYNSFYTNSVNTAKWIGNNISKYKSNENLSILDWGCGPGRVIRHLPSFFDNTCTFFGTDYNKKYVKWCADNIKKVTFSENQLQPPLRYNENTFDAIYGISIFTHLSEEMHFAWFKELMRVLKPGGILLVTLQGESFRAKLTDAEKIGFDKGELVIKSNTKEGHRTYCAFHPDKFVHKLVGENEVLEVIEGVTSNGKAEQNLWIIKKK